MYNSESNTRDAAMGNPPGKEEGPWARLQPPAGQQHRPFSALPWLLVMGSVYFIFCHDPPSFSYTLQQELIAERLLGQSLLPGHLQELAQEVEGEIQRVGFAVSPLAGLQPPWGSGGWGGLCPTGLAQSLGQGAGGGIRGLRGSWPGLPGGLGGQGQPAGWAPGPLQG